MAIEESCEVQILWTSGPVATRKQISEKEIIIIEDDEPQKEANSTENENKKSWFINFSSNIMPFFPLSLGSRTFTALLDTGAGVNVIGSKVLQEHLPDYWALLETADVRGRDVSNNIIEFSGKIRLDVLFGDHAAYVDFYVIPNSSSLILGNQYLCDNSLIIVPGKGFGSKLPSEEPDYKILYEDLKRTHDLLLTRGV